MLSSVWMRVPAVAMLGSTWGNMPGSRVHCVWLGPANLGVLEYRNLPWDIYSIAEKYRG